MGQKQTWGLFVGMSAPHWTSKHRACVRGATRGVGVVLHQNLKQLEVSALSKEVTQRRMQTDFGIRIVVHHGT